MKTLLSFVVVIMSLITTLGMAQSNSSSTTKMPMHENMTMESSMNHENMAGMGQLMMRMSDAFAKHKMTDEQRTECARFMNRLSEVLMSCADDVELKAVDKHKADIEKITEEWNYFERGNFEEH